MKKLIPILLVVLLMVGLMPLGVYAEDGEKSETFNFAECVGSHHVEGKHFNLDAVASYGGGWFGGNALYPLTITARENGVGITRIEAHICIYGYNYSKVGVTRGTKEPGSLNGADFGDVSVNNIIWKDFAFSTEGVGGDFASFDRITVYYKDCNTDGHFYDGNNICGGCGKTKCEIIDHIYDDDNVCVNCHKSKCEIVGQHSYNESGSVCTVCNKTKCEIEGHHSYENGVCTVCLQTCKNGFHNQVLKCQECGMTVTTAVENPTAENPTTENPPVTASTLSQGNMTIVCTVAGIAVGFLAAMFIFKKKKPAATEE